MVFARKVSQRYALTRSESEVESGGGGCRRNLWAFAVSFGFAALVTNTLTTYITSQVTALQKQYELSSTAVGAILSCNDVGFLATVLLVSHLGHRAHIPRLLALATLLFGLSGVLSALTYFLQPVTLPTLSSLPPGGTSNASASPLESGRLCRRGGEGAGGHGEDCGAGGQEASGSMLVLVLLGLSMVLQGVAKAPRVSLSTTYVDDNTPDKARTSLYMGSILTISLFGPPIAILMGGVFRKLPVDLKATTLTPSHPDWIGCWWLGFLVFGVGALLMAMPLFLFARSMRARAAPPGAFTPVTSDLQDPKVKDTEVKDEEVKDLEVNQVNGHKVTEMKGKDEAATSRERKGDEDPGAEESPIRSVWRQLKDLPVSLLRMHREPVYALTLWGIVAVKFGISGEISFGPKYVEHQFQLPAYKTNLIMGTQKIIGVTLGTFLGGLLTSRLRLGRVGCLKFLVMTKIISLGLKSFNFYFGCNNPSIRGLDLSGLQSAVAAAPGGCDCSGAPYFPVCGDNSTSFFSPCFAGCTNITSSSGYSACAETMSGEVAPGLCESDCPWLYYYMAADLVGALLGTLGIMPAFMTIIRSVEEGDRSIAMGLCTFLTSLLSYLPAPLVFGYVIDSTCLVWGRKCGKRGACALYDVVSQRFRYKGLVVGLYGTGLLLFALALLVAFRQEKKSGAIKAMGAADSKIVGENSAVIAKTPRAETETNM